MLNKTKINVAIQLLPIGSNTTLETIDKAIKLIQDSNLKYIVCPFETVVEGSYSEIFSLVDLIRTTTLQNGCPELIINLKIHASTSDLNINDKLIKYNHNA